MIEMNANMFLTEQSSDMGTFAMWVCCVPGAGVVLLSGREGGTCWSCS